jgi:hypothetical protein
MPLDIPLLNNEKFIQDRKERWGIDFSMETRAQNRAVSLVLTKSNITLLGSFLKDGRPWILGSESVGLADIHGE